MCRGRYYGQGFIEPHPWSRRHLVLGWFVALFSRQSFRPVVLKGGNFSVVARPHWGATLIVHDSLVLRFSSRPLNDAGPTALDIHVPSNQPADVSQYVTKRATEWRGRSECLPGAGRRRARIAEIASPRQTAGSRRPRRQARQGMRPKA